MSLSQPTHNKVNLIPYDEKERLEVLRNYNFLQELIGNDFRKINFLAMQIFKCPISAITFVQENSVQLISSMGYSIKEVPRHCSFCNYTILSDDVFIVSNTLNDHRFSEIPAVQERNIRFYIGAPLITHSGHRIGSLCVLGKTPKKVTKYQIISLKYLAKYAMLLLENKRNEINKKLAEKNLINEVCLKNEKLFQYEQNVFCNVLTVQVLNEVNRTLADIYIKSIKTSSILVRKEFNKNIVLNDVESISVKSFNTAKKINSIKTLYRNLSQNNIQITNMSNIIETVNLFFLDKIKSHEIQYNIVMDVDPNLEFECRPSSIVYILLYLINNSIKILKYKKCKWIELLLTEFTDRIEFCFMDSCNRFERGLFHKDDIIPKHQFHNQFYFIDIKLLSNMIDRQGGYLKFDKISDNTNIIFVLPKRVAS
ncbi:GAF domain-containing protein [Fluviispira vulneris]|uniref:GAF domain-containing protein n=1 Tax=Fluviispira vulneris TaxID=2763012 RepID=UPI00164946A6|nr:GAF domain-containing protein [Fluviispira vulneris]